jgi:hypothetical protein
LGWLDEAIRCAQAAQKEVAHPIDVDSARHNLTTCQERFQRIEQVFSTNLVSYERLKDLTGFGGERGGEWGAWVIGVKQGIEHCVHPIKNARNCLADCWQEVAERTGGPSISVRTTNIGQKIVSTEAERLAAAPKSL